MKARSVKALTALALAGAGAALLLAAEPEFGRAVHPGSPGAWMRQTVSRLPAGAVVLLCAGAAAGIAAFLRALAPRRRRRKGEPGWVRVVEEPPTPWWAYALVAGMLMGISLTGYRLLSERGGSDSGSLPAQLPPAVSEAGIEPGDITGRPGQVAATGAKGVSGWADAWIAGAILLGAAALPVMARLRRRAAEDSRSGDSSDTAPLVAARPGANDAGMGAAEFERLAEAVARADDPTEAVMAAFHLLELITGGLGQRRPPSQTPAEYLAAGCPAVIRKTAEADRLAHLYCKAAYGSGPVGPSDQVEAVKAVRRLWELLQQGRPQ
ncbi:MAG: DUF4129 domain-containing protein [Bacillota bacterium]